jgi:hypothetical protein
MRKPIRIDIAKWAYHRNGISGVPFHVVLFDDVGDENTRKVGILFETPHHCAVLDVGKLVAGNIAFGSNSYRGDVFEEQLRKAPLSRCAGPFASPNHPRKEKSHDHL